MLNGTEIKRRREALGMSQGELADKCGLSQQAMSRIESNLSKGTSRIGRLAEALDCSINDIDTDVDLPEMKQADRRTTADKPPKSPAGLSGEAVDMLAKIAGQMEKSLGFRPTDAQVIRHLVTKSAYSELLD